MLRTLLATSSILLGLSADAVTGSTLPPSDNIQFKDSYCGMYVLYAALTLADKPVDFADLLRPEYVDSHKGSTVGQLTTVAQDYGLYTELIGDMTPSVLQELKHPVILHVRQSVESEEPDHFALFLGRTEEGIVLYDPPRPARTMSLEELHEVWEGTGLILSETPISLARIFVIAWIDSLSLIALSACLIGFAYLLSSRRKRSVEIGPRHARLVEFGARCLLLMGFVTLLYVTHKAIAGSPVEHRASFTSPPGFSQAPTKYSSIALAELKRSLESDAVIIDARYPTDFELGHIGTAINIPVNSSSEVRQGSLTDVPKDSPIVVYCQSKQCPYSEIVADALAADGFTDLAIFEGGWLEWSAHDSSI